MGTWNSRGLRGSTLEDMVNRTNEWYLEKNLALMQKIPTPITPVRMDKEHRQITLAYFDQRSTIDYIGAVQGIPVCFDAKECVAETFPLQNIHEPCSPPPACISAARSARGGRSPRRSPAASC